MNNNLLNNYNDYLLYGNSIKGIKAIDYDKKYITVFYSNKTKKYKHQPYIFIEKKEHIQRLKHSHIEELKGEGHKYIVYFDNINDYYNATKYLYMIKANYIKMNDMPTQFMMKNGCTLFKGVEFSDLKRMQLDIETLKGIQIEGNEIACIAVKCNEYEEVIDGTHKQIITRLNNVVAEQDPDVIETYNGENFDWRVLVDVSRRCKVPLKLGRNGEILKTYKTSIKISEEQSVLVEKHSAFGRHIIDLYYLAKKYNMIKRIFDSYGLKAIVKTLGKVRDDREFVDGADIAKVWISGEDGKQRIKRYVIDDVRDLKIVSDLLLPVEFYQTQMLPIPFEKVCISGVLNKINSVFYRYYYKQKTSIPIMEQTDISKYEGALVGREASGIFRNCCKVDISSLYPSIMLHFKVFPPNDTLNVFEKFLYTITQKRLELKKQMKTLSGKEKQNIDAIQGAYKVFINSFYGLMGCKASPFAYKKGAEDVTAKGREILKNMIESLKNDGNIIIEYDTDGVIFQPAEKYRKVK